MKPKYLGVKNWPYEVNKYEYKWIFIKLTEDDFNKKGEIKWKVIHAAVWKYIYSLYLASGCESGTKWHCMNSDGTQGVYGYETSRYDAKIALFDENKEMIVTDKRIGTKF